MFYIDWNKPQVLDIVVLMLFFLKRKFYEKCPYEHTLYIKTGDRGKMLIVCLYVDDLIFTRNGTVMFKKIKESIMFGLKCLI